MNERLYKLLNRFEAMMRRRLRGSFDGHMFCSHQSEKDGHPGFFFEKTYFRSPSLGNVVWTVRQVDDTGEMTFSVRLRTDTIVISAAEWESDRVTEEFGRMEGLIFGHLPTQISDSPIRSTVSTESVAHAK